MHRISQLVELVWRWRGLCALAVVLCGSAWASAEAPARDSVQKLLDTLQSPGRDPSAHEELLAQRVKALRGITDLRRALLSQDWRDEDEFDDAIRKIHHSQRTAVAKRFESAVRDLLQRGDATSRMAVAQMLSEMGAAMDYFSSVSPRGRFSNLAGVFALDLIRVAKQEETPVQTAAIRALGKIHNPDVALPALRDFLTAQDLTLRLATAEALGDLITTESIYVRQPSGELIRVLQVVAPVAARGLSDIAPEVRRLCLKALQEAANALRRQVPEIHRHHWQVENPQESAKVLEEGFRSLLPLARSLSEQVPAVAGALKDADLAVRLAANQALEAMADARLQLLGLAASGTRLAANGAAGKPPEDPLRTGLRAAVPLLVPEISHPEVRVRLAALYVLETLATEAAPAAEAVVKVLQDTDPFVRWAAVRTLGKMAPLEADKSVPGLAKLVDDENADVRLTALAALERFGPQAKVAVPALRQAVNRKDPESRVAAIQALAAIGLEARAAASELITALSAPEAEVRLAAAASLAKLGPLTPRAEEALRKALNDPNGEVRLAASDALLVGK